MRNLLAAIDKDLANQWLDGLQLKGLELFGADWSVLTRELKATDRAIRSRRKADKGLTGLGHRQTPQTPPSYDAAAAAAKHPATPANASALHPAAPPATPRPRSDECWTHQFNPPCPLGEDACPHKHVGEAGSKRHLLADDRGFSKRDKRDDCDRGTECKFRHISHDTAGGPMGADGEYQQEVAAINARGPPKKMFSMQRSPFQGEAYD